MTRCGGNAMKAALTIFVLLAFLAGAVWVGHYGWESAGDVTMPAWGWWMMGLGIFFTVVVGGGLMALVFYSSRAGYDEPPHLAQKRKARTRRKDTTDSTQL
jgi:hypothetical protein